jgi:DNA-binding response OmpR family regulator
MVAEMIGRVGRAQHIGVNTRTLGAISQLDCAVGGKATALLDTSRRVRLKYPRLPVIFITAHYDDDTRKRALSQGAAGFLHKPFDAADLLGAIELALTTPPEG